MEAGMAADGEWSVAELAVRSRRRGGEWGPPVNFVLPRR